MFAKNSQTASGERAVSYFYYASNFAVHLNIFQKKKKKGNVTEQRKQNTKLRKVSEITLRESVRCSGKESACNSGDSGLIPGLGRSPGGGNDNPLQYSCLETPMDRGVWRARVCGGQKEEDTTARLSRHVREIRSPSTDQGLKVPSLSVNALNCWFPPKGKLCAAVHFVMGRDYRRLPICKGLIETAININILPHTLVSHGSKSTPPGHAHPPFCLAFSYTHLLLEGHC